jgi:alginate O-acetyltransferase complex protein AlgI
MLFNSYVFIFIFLPFAVIGFFILERNISRRSAFMWLVACSLFFYGWWNPIYLPLLLTSIVCNYAISLGLRHGERSDNVLVSRRVILFVGVIANLLAIAYFKYFGFFGEVVNSVGSFGWEIETTILPLAISFFTFQQITYLVDTYNGETGEPSFLNYCLFVSFFPQLIAGPIVHHKEMMPQFNTLDIGKFMSRNLAIGITIFSIGLFKKVILADTVAEFATPVFDGVENGNTVDLILAWQGALAYTLQIYFDFSGYSDMAIGLAKMFGITLPLNFNSPYKSLSIIEFWRRWHMTLSRFLKDYVYIPMGGSQKGSKRRYVNLLTTMLLGGLWHGAGWSFVIWGGFHGTYLIINHGWHVLVRYFSLQRFQEGPIWRVAAFGLTMTAVIIGWVFFRAESLGTALSILSSMIGQNGFVLPVVFEPYLKGLSGASIIDYSHGGGSDFIRIWIFISGFFAIALFLPNTQQIMRKIGEFNPLGKIENHYAIELPLRLQRIEWNNSFKWAFSIGILLAASIMSLHTNSEFLYFQF